MNDTCDLHYQKLGMFTSFYPCTPSGVNAFNEICKAQGDTTGKVLTVHLKATLQQLRWAGYKVKVEPNATCTTSAKDDDALLLELLKA